MKRCLLVALVALMAVPTAACDDGSGDGGVEPAAYKGALGKTDASAEAVFLDFTFEAELLAPHCFDAPRYIQDQLLYTVGQLNGERAVGRLDQLDVTKTDTAMEDGACRVSYTARLPVAWAKKDAVPDTYDLLLPVDARYAGKDAFVDAYSHDCVDWGAHDVDAGSMWYYYRPNRSSCRLEDADIVRAVAKVSPSPIATTGKYPEYDKVWEDGALKVVAVFGKYEDGATSGDAGIDAYNTFVRAIRDELGDSGLKTTPEAVPTAPGVATPDITFEATLADGKAVRVVTLLVDNVRTAGAAFDARYEALSSDADLIVYNGHAGLGANIRALAQKGAWVSGQYVIVFMNGCDTYAYVDAALAEAHADVNPDDPEGTRYVDVVTNAMPSFFRSMANATMAMVRGLMAYDAPKTYEQIFTDIDASEVVLVSGEHDNTFVPGAVDPEEPADPAWAGLDEQGELAKDEEVRFASPKLPMGRYRFQLAGDGDADLYVRVGEEPSLTLYDCRPYLAGSDEVCDVVLPAEAEVHAMVVGWASRSSWALTATEVTEP